MPWNPDTYHKFQAQRAAPFEDLVKLINVRDGLRVIDLGCGTGELTARLADMLPHSEVVGIDNSAEMLERARSLERYNLRFEQMSIEDVIDDPENRGGWDVVFSHAAIHWVEDHERLIPALLGLVRNGGQIAVQMPSNHSHFTHQTITALASSEPYRTALDGWVRVPPVLSIERYAEMLFEGGAEDITVMEKIYPHILENADGMADWTSGTALVPYFERLGDDFKAQFDAEYRKRLRERFAGSPVFYGFRRILFAAMRP
jgi:trans-aconitate 2-methyltransferase